MGDDDGIELGDGDGIVDGLDFNPGIFVGVGVGAMAGVGLGDGGSIVEGIQIFIVNGIEEEQIDGRIFGSLVRNGVGIGDGIGLGHGAGIGAEFKVCTLEVLGSLLGLHKGIRDDTAVVGGLVGAGVGKDEGIGLGSVEGNDEGLEV